MKHGIIEGFEMHRTKEGFGIPSNGNRVSLIEKAGALGFHGVEFGISHDYAEDPFWNGEGEERAHMKNACEVTGVEATSVCLHMLNDISNSPGSCEPSERETAHLIIKNTIVACDEVGIPLILIPCFGSAALKKDEQIEHLIEGLKLLAPIAQSHRVSIGLETSLSAPDMVRIIDAIGSDHVKVYFDTGNADIIGYNILDEIKELGSRIVQVHMKENPSGILGQGKINFKAVYKALEEQGYDGYLVLETPALNDAIASASRNLGYMEGLSSVFA